MSEQSAYPEIAGGKVHIKVEDDGSSNDRLFNSTAALVEVKNEPVPEEFDDIGASLKHEGSAFKKKGAETPLFKAFPVVALTRLDIEVEGGLRASSFQKSSSITASVVKVKNEVTEAGEANSIGKENHLLKINLKKTRENQTLEADFKLKDTASGDVCMTHDPTINSSGECEAVLKKEEHIEDVEGTENVEEFEGVLDEREEVVDEKIMQTSCNNYSAKSKNQKELAPGPVYSHSAVSFEHLKDFEQDDKLVQNAIKREESGGVCENELDSKAYISSSETTCTKPKLFSCSYCFAEFKTSLKMEHHLRIHVGEQLSAGMPNGATLSTVQEGRHLNVCLKPFSCAQCGAMFSEKRHLNRHFLVHSDKRPFACEQCPAAFKTKSNLKLHVASHSNEKLFSCSQCAALFKTKNGLVRHLAAHSGVRIPKFSCPHCNTQFLHSSSLSRHLLTHSNEKPFGCTLCSASFCDKFRLKQHSFIHTNQRKFSCAQCPAAFYSRSHLNQHLLSHSDEKRFSCTQCAASFKTKAGLKRHSVLHSNEIFRCSHCTTKFVSESSLNRHQAGHACKRQFTCAHCGFKFNNKARLRRHVGLHLREKLFSCTHCSAKFYLETSLKRHSVVHCKKIRFPCPKCNTTFLYMGSLKRHLRSAICSSVKPCKRGLPVASL